MDNTASRDLNTPHLFTPLPTRAAWESRAAELRERILFACGLFPLPKKTPLKPRTTGRTEYADFIVENVALETFPGFYLCGNLYRPKGKGAYPAIANPHGHWTNGRKERQEDVPKAPPPPAAPPAGRADLVALPANLARQGFVAFAYDMVGYNDTNQIPHRQLGARLEDWLWGVSEFGLQTWNSIRVLDYLCTLPFVDKERIGVTGASGGGTQTFILAAIDARVKVSVPVNMVSATMQGGCNCENAPGLRLGTDNAEIAAVFAPKPQLLVSCTGDWTRENLTKEVPAIRSVYDLYGATDKLGAVQFNYQHNYNSESREAMYAFFRKWLLNAPAERERPVDIAPATLTVWTSKDPRPASALTANEIAPALRAERKRTAEAGISSRKTRARRGLQLALGVIVPEKARRGRGEYTLTVRVGSPARVPNTLELPPLPATAKPLWENFFATYNRTPLGDRVQAIVDRLVTLQEQGIGHVTLVGEGEAGLWVLLARAVAPNLLPGKTLTDYDLAAPHPPESLYAPGLMAVLGTLSNLTKLVPN
jgi:hypothetical protein